VGQGLEMAFLRVGEIEHEGNRTWLKIRAV